jgi:hypothetical protein
MAFKARLNFTGKEYQVLYHSYSPFSGPHHPNIDIPLRFYFRKLMSLNAENFNDWPKA